MDELEKKENGLPENEAVPAPQPAEADEKPAAQAAQEENASEENTPEENSAEENASEDNAPADALGEELEEIRSKLQQLLDESAETYLAGGDIQAYDDEEPQEEISEEELCTCCGEKRRDTTHGEDYPYCEDCRKLMQHYPFSFNGILALVCVIVITGIAFFGVLGDNIDVATGAVNADLDFKLGKVNSALNAYSQVLEPYASNTDAFTTVTVPKKVAKRFADAFASLTDYSYASYVVEKFFTEDDLKNPVYRSLADYKSKSEFLNKISETVNGAIGEGDVDAEAICELLEKMKDEEGSEPFFLDYFKYKVKKYFGDLTNEESYEELKKLKEAYPAQWSVAYELCSVAAKLGKTDEAVEYYKETVKHNVENESAYASLADAYRFGEKADPDKMLEAVQTGLDAMGDSGYSVSSLNRVKAVAYLLKGDYDAAYDAAAEAYKDVYTSLYYGYNVENVGAYIYTYQLCAHLKGDNDAYESAGAILGYVGLGESKDVERFIKGKATLEAILTDGEGDLA